MTAENRILTDWALRERQHDLAWIGDKLALFHLAEIVEHEEVGPGAIVVDITSQPIIGAGNPFGYVVREEIERSGDEETKRLVREYDPANHEMVVMLLKPFNRTSTYRLRTQPRVDKETGNGFT